MNIAIQALGGDMLFASQSRGLAESPLSLRHKIEGKMAIHPAAGGYERRDRLLHRNTIGSTV